MKGLPVRLLFAAALLLTPSGLLAATNCDAQPKPAFSCPQGYGIMCIPTGGDHWGCGRENAVGDIDETAPVSQEQASADPVVAAPSETQASTTAAEPAPRAQTTSATAPVAATSAPKPAPAPVNAPEPPATQPTTEPADAAPPEETPSAPAVVTLEDAQEITEAVADAAPAAFQPFMYAIAGALAMLVAVLGFQEMWRKVRDAHSTKCMKCGGTGRESSSDICANCEGKGVVEEEYEAEGKCPHCDGEGEDPCHDCDGTGEVAREGQQFGSPCEECEGTGKGRDEDGEAVECCTCGGEGEAAVTMTREVTCPECGGKKS